MTEKPRRLAPVFNIAEYRFDHMLTITVLDHSLFLKKYERSALPVIECFAPELVFVYNYDERNDPGLMLILDEYNKAEVPAWGRGTNTRMGIYVKYTMVDPTVIYYPWDKEGQYPTIFLNMVCGNKQVKVISCLSDRYWKNLIAADGLMETNHEPCIISTWSDKAMQTSFKNVTIEKDYNTKIHDRSVFTTYGVRTKNENYRSSDRTDK